MITSRCVFWLVIVLSGNWFRAESQAEQPPAVSPPSAVQPPAADSPAADLRAGQDATAEQLAELKRQEEYYELFKLFADTLDQVERNYVQEIDRRELVEAAIAGVIGKLDPYSSYISPGELANFRSSIDSEFGGIGIQITLDAGQLKILSPIVGSPAYRQGLQAGDKIFKIDDLRPRACRSIRP